MTENKNARTSADGPVAWGCQCGRAYTVTCISSKPLKREWVSLTDEQIIKHFQEHVDTGSLSSFADGVRFAEAAHGIKEKNQ